MPANLSEIRRLRKALRLTQTDVALRLGYRSDAGYSRLETGQRRLRVEHLTILADMLGVPVADLLTAEGRDNALPAG